MIWPKSCCFRALESRDTHANFLTGFPSKRECTRPFLSSMVVCGNILGHNGHQCWEQFQQLPPLLKSPSLHAHVFFFLFPHYCAFSLLLVGIFPAAHLALPYTRLHCPRTHGYTVGGHCGCSIGLCPDTLQRPQRLPGGGSLHCSCTRLWFPLCTPCQTPVHSWGPQEAHRKELAKGKQCHEHFWFKMVF